MVVTTALIGVLTMLTFDAVTRMTPPSNQGVAEQEAARTGGALLDRIARELRYADADTLVHSAADPGTITYQEVLAYESDAGTDGAVVRSRPVTLRLRAIGGAHSDQVVERFENPSLTGIDDAAQVVICHHNQGEGLGTNSMVVAMADVEAHLRHGDRIGPCDGEPVPVAADAFLAGATVLGGPVAASDAVTSALPGLNFGVRRIGPRTYIDIAITVVGRVGAETARRRFSTTVALINRGGA